MSKLTRLFKTKNGESNYIVVATDPDSSYAESFRKIPINLKYSRIDNEPRVIQVTSALAGEHKTTSAANISAVYHELGHSVVLVDCDLRKPRVHRITSLVNTSGLTEHLIGNVTYQNLIKRCKYGFDVINAGETVPFPHVILRSEKFKALIDKLRQEYEYVIIDCPPVLLVTDSLIIGEICDASIFVINQRNTKKSTTKEAVRIMKESKLTIAGIILSNTSKKVRRYGKYYSYRYKYGGK